MGYSSVLKRARLLALALVALLAVGAAVAAAQDEPAEPDMGEPDEPALAIIEVTVWRNVADPSLLYLSTRPQGGSWRTVDTPLDMSALSRSGRFHQSNAISVAVPLPGGGRANVQVTVWRSVANPAVLYLSTRPEGGSWRTEDERLDMSTLSRSGRFHQSNAVTVIVSLPNGDAPAEPDIGAPTPTPTPTPAPGDSTQCRLQDTAARVIASTVRVDTPTGTGSAFYVGNGQFVTAAHVVDDNPSTIRLRNARYDAYASIVGYTDDEDGDLAILSAPASGLTALQWAGTLSVGETIIVVGYPEGMGLSASITRGIVSRRFTAEGVAYIQTDSAASPGNSGGPLVDACGRVAGVMSGSIIGERGSEGLHFAVAEPTLGSRLAALRSGQYARPARESRLTVTAFCTKLRTEEVDSAECNRRSISLDLSGNRQWYAYARGVSDWDNVLFRFNGGSSHSRSGVWSALQSLGIGCHEAQMAEENVSTHWSNSYQFCIIHLNNSLARAERATLWVRIYNDYLGYINVEFSTMETVFAFQGDFYISSGLYSRRFFPGSITFPKDWSERLCCSYSWEWTMRHTSINKVSASLRVDGYRRDYRCEFNTRYSERNISMWACEER